MSKCKNMLPYMILLAGLFPAMAHARVSEAGKVNPVQAEKLSPAQKYMGDIAPKLTDLTDDVLSGDIWERKDLSKRDRSLITISALIALNRPEQMRSYFALALRHGVTEQEIIETITHLAFYAGWPSAVTAISVAKEVFGADKTIAPTGD